MSAVLSVPTAPRRSRWPLALATLLVLAAGALALAWSGIQALAPVPLNISIDVQRVVQGLDLASMPPAHQVVLAALLAFALLAALIIVPMAVTLTLLGLLVAALALVALPLLAAVAVLAIVLSPLLLLVWLTWKLLT
jgi:hypothetical protein